MVNGGLDGSAGVDDTRIGEGAPRRGAVPSNTIRPLTVAPGPVTMLKPVMSCPVTTIGTDANSAGASDEPRLEIGRTSSECSPGAMPPIENVPSGVTVPPLVVLPGP